MNLSDENPSKQRFLTLMGEDLGTVYYKLYNRIAYLHHIWYNYLELFGAEKSRIDILNDSAPYFFHIVQKGLHENIILSLSRITDPIESLGKKSNKNLTLLLLPTLIQDAYLKKEVELQIDKIVLFSVKFARDLRSKIYAHEDYNISMGYATLEENSSLEKISFALKTIRTLMNSITKYYDNSRTGFHNSTNGGAIALLKSLQDSINLDDYIKDKRYKGEKIDDLLERNLILDNQTHFDID